MAVTLEVEVAPAHEAGGYPVTARTSGGGEADGTLLLDVPAMLKRRGELQARVLASAVTAVRGGLAAVEVPLREVGEQLFSALINERIYGQYSAAVALARQRGEPLRLVLRLRAPELAALPWEMMYDAETGGYVCRAEPLVRHLAVPAPAPVSIDPPLRVLGLVAAPRDLPALDSPGERDRMDQALAGLGDRVQLVWAPGGTWDDLTRVLLDGPWHAVHFIGHSGFDPTTGEGTIALEKNDGGVAWVRADRFALLLSLQHPAPRLVVLNSCSSAEASQDDLFSSTGAALVRSGVSAAVAMQFVITDIAAKAFSAGFYQAIASGRTISEAVRVGRIGIAGPGDSLEWTTPVLYLRGDDAQDAPLFVPRPTDARPVGPSPEQAARLASVAALYEQAVERARAGDDERALALFDALLNLEPAYRDADEHRDAARARLREPHPRRDEQQAVEPAGMGLRFAARLIDWGIGCSVGFAILVPFSGVVMTDSGNRTKRDPGNAAESAEFTTFGAVLAFCLILLVVGVNTTLIARQGATLGMRMVAITLIREVDAGVPGWRGSAIRAAVQTAAVVTVVGPLVLAISPALDPRGLQGWHDKVAGVLLVRRPHRATTGRRR